MKKVWTTLFIFSLFFLFSFSSAETLNDFKSAFGELRTQYTGDITVTDLSGMDNIVEKFLASEQHLSNMQNYEYYYLFFFNNVKFRIYYSDVELDFKYHSVYLNSTKTSHRFSPYNNTTSNANCYYVGYAYDSVSSSFSVLHSRSFVLASKSYSTATSNYSGFDLCYTSFNYFYWDNFEVFLNCMYGNYDVHYYYTDDIIFSANSSSSIKMENPLIDDEIKSILQIFIDSVKDADLPEHYGRYVLTYNKVTERYTGFVYPNYINLGMKYCDFDENEEFYYVENSTGPYYLFTEYSKDNDYISQFLEGINLGMKKPLLYEFRSNSNNTFFRFNTTYDFGAGFENSFVLSTLDEPIIYTSHKIYSLFLVGEDILGFGKYEEDEETSIDNKVLTDDETGLPVDSTINESTEEVNKDINLFSFIQLLFGFIFSLIGFLVKFFTFIVSFIIVPASTNILPEGFIQGIDWIHSFAFGDILLWDIFSILFLVLLSIYIVKLIRSH